MNDIFNTESIINEAFGNKVELFPSVNELFELELAHLEYKSLSGIWQKALTISF